LTGEVDVQITGLTAAVAGTARLRGWRLGFGHSAEVIEPAALRDEFRKAIGQMASAYGGVTSEPGTEEFWDGVCWLPAALMAISVRE
jgi:hypothetical protein